MKILWLTWKDKANPQAGGAEVVNEELAKRLVQDGHEVLFVVAGFPRSVSREKRDGFEIVRLGNRWSVYWHAYRYYKKNLQTWPDLVIDEVNTMPFFAKFYVKQRNILFFHMLCREIWFYEMPFPFSLIGYLLEPLYLRMLSNKRAITVSNSSKLDLQRFCFKEVYIISEGIEIVPISDLNAIQKFSEPTILSFGSVRAMKRTDQVVRAFEIAKKEIPALELVIAGGFSGSYGEKVRELINKSAYKDSIKTLGKVSGEQKIELMQKAHLIAVTSVKEGWGLIVTEANSQGAPAVTYNVDGLRDAVKDKETGLLAEKNTPQGLADKLIQLLGNKDLYEKLRKNAWEWSKDINFEKSYKQFLEII
jgi:glycosyltransferase involved in cell wall biosynthesis